MNLTLTAAAVEHLAEDADGRVLRIAFTTGCGGSGYRLSYAPEAAEGDELMNVDGVDVALEAGCSSRLSFHNCFPVAASSP